MFLQGVIISDNFYHTSGGEGTLAVPSPFGYVTGLKRIGKLMGVPRNALNALNNWLDFMPICHIL
jgi:hypothetical protein